MTNKELLCHPATARINGNLFAFQGAFFYLRDEEVRAVHDECLDGLTAFVGEWTWRQRLGRLLKRLGL